jgi:hypothetical protein
MVINALASGHNSSLCRRSMSFITALPKTSSPLTGVAPLSYFGYRPKATKYQAIAEKLSRKRHNQQEYGAVKLVANRQGRLWPE